MTKSVVIVDDSMFQTLQLSRFFREVLNFEVLAIGENGEEAKEFYRQYQPDLLTLDLTMPKLDGREAIVQILQDFPTAKILVISAIKGPLLLDCLSLGAKSYIEKPLRLENANYIRDFKNTVEEILKFPSST